MYVASYRTMGAVEHALHTCCNAVTQSIGMRGAVVRSLDAAGASLCCTLAKPYVYG